MFLGTPFFVGSGGGVATEPVGWDQVSAERLWLATAMAEMKKHKHSGVKQQAHTARSKTRANPGIAFPRWRQLKLTKGDEQQRGVGVVSVEPAKYHCL